jgi:hypothetical protein
MNNSTPKKWLIATITSMTYFTSFTAIAALKPAAVAIGELNLYPTVDISSSYNDNFRYRENNEESSWITSVNPNFVLEGEQRNAKYQLSYGLDQGIFHSSSADDYLDHDLSGAANFIGNSRNRVDLEAGYRKGHETRGRESGGSSSDTPKPLEFDLQTLGAVYTFGRKEAKGRIKLRANYADKNYTNFKVITDSRDYSRTGVGSTFYYRMSGKMSALFELTGNKVEYDDSNKDNRNTKVFTGLSWDTTGKTTGEIKVGYAEKDFDDASLNDTDGSTWDAEVTWKPKSYSTFTLNFGQDFAESNGNNTFIDTDTYIIDWSHLWSDRLKSTLALETFIEQFSNSPRKETTSDFTIGLNYNSRRWLNLGVAYTLRDKDSNFPNLSYQSNEIAFTLRASM